MRWRSKKMAISLNGFLANQFANKDNFIAHYETTGNEILNELSVKIGGFIWYWYRGNSNGDR